MTGVFFVGAFYAGVFLTGDLAGDLGAALAGVLALVGVLPVLGVSALHLSDRSLLLRPLRGVANLGSLRILAQLPADGGVGRSGWKIFFAELVIRSRGTEDRRAELASTPPRSAVARA